MYERIISYRIHIILAKDQLKDIYDSKTVLKKENAKLSDKRNVIFWNISNFKNEKIICIKVIEYTMDYDLESGGKGSSNKNSLS